MQTNWQLEFVVFDDGSPDNTAEVVASYPRRSVRAKAEARFC